ncbi:hypothetical protein [Dictyobacter kobayashii]|uniref:Uncharacterized protein n=1 Tax=Dictyobacter kobayashii TaxID=2014872 RepID=A0A402ALA0_9CHLR|nr:hypothetical protein [Dictyobacter kobayashii]GCE19829.1 hypothetical protein KDK_36290 [Dictyobacter kobayashii]
MTWQGAFRVIIRVIFIFAYIAFLAASIRHVATFFHNFEADPSDWVNPYTLAVSIDLTALVLTVGVMFFRGNMPWYAQSFTWVFIVALTAFSWFVNWEYAMTYQGNELRVNDTLRMLNPILASSFAFLNLAYSVVAEFFSSRNESAAELAAKVDELEQLEEQQRRLAEYKARTRQPSVIQRVKNTALEARAAVNEVLTTEQAANQAALATGAEVSSTRAVASINGAQLPAQTVVLHEQAAVEEIEESVVVEQPEPAEVEQAAELVMETPAPTSFQQSDESLVVTQPLDDEELAEEELQSSEDELKHITEPLSMEATQYIIDSSQKSGELEASAITAGLRNGAEGNAFLPAWAGGEDVNTFLTMEDMAPYIPSGDTASMSKISSATGKLTRRKPMSVSEAAEVLALSERRVRELRSQGVLLTDESNKIKVASVNAYLGKRKAK